MTLEPDRRSLPGIGHHGYPLARPPAQKLARTGGALHLQASSQFTDSAAAAGLRALEKRVDSVPVAVYEFLQAGGVPAAVTIITSEPVAPELRDAAISLLSAVARKQPQAMSLAFTEAKGMAAVVHLLGRGIQPRGGALTKEGADTVAAAARLLEAALDAGGQAAGGAFGAAGGFAALRTAIACGQLSGQHASEVAERAVGLLHRLVWAGNKSFAGPQHAAMCAAVCAARTHQPLLALIYTNSHVDAAVKGMEVLRALAAASNACMHALLQSNCIDTCLTVLDRADLNSSLNMRTAILAALLLHDALEWNLACRGDIVAKGGVSTCLNVLARTPNEDTPIADVINSLLSSLAEGSHDLTQQDGKRPLHWAAQFGELEALEKFLAGYPNLQAQDERGNTALHLAAAAGLMAAVKLLVAAGADATARNFAGALPHDLAMEGSPLWASLLSELDWRACLEQPRPCQYAANEGDALCSGNSEDWQGPAKCFFLPLSGHVRIESAGVPSPSSKHWFISAIKGHRSKGAHLDQQPRQQPGQLLHEFKLPPDCDITALDDLTLSLEFRHDLTSAAGSGNGGSNPEEDQSVGLAGVNIGIERGVERKGGGRIGRLVIRVDSSPDQCAPDLAHAIRAFLHRCYPDSQAVATGSEDTSGAHGDDSGVESAPAMSPRSTLSHFLRSADAIQAKRAGSQQLHAPQSPQDEQSSAALSPSLPQLESHEPEAAGRAEEAASSCCETQQRALESVSETEGQVHSALRGAKEGGLSEERVALPHPPPHAAAESSRRQVSATTAPGQRRSSSALEIARRLRRTPASKSGALANAKAGKMSEAKLGAQAGRRASCEPPSGSASVAAEAGAASSRAGVTADANFDRLGRSASSSTGRSCPGTEQEVGKVHTAGDLAAGHVCQASCGDGCRDESASSSIGRSDPGTGHGAGSKVQSEEDSAAEHVCQEVGDAHASLLEEEKNARADLPAAAAKGLAKAPKTSSNKAAAKALHTMSYLPLAENQQRSRRYTAPPPPPPPPPLLRNYGPAATVDSTATAAAVRAADEFRRQQQAFGRGKLYAPTAQSVADKVRELELQIGLVQQLNSQGLRKDEVPAHAAKPALPPNHAHSSGGDSAASGELCTMREGQLEPDAQGAGLQAESAADEGTPGGQVIERHAESALPEGTLIAQEERLLSGGSAAAAPTRSAAAAERAPADAAATVAQVTGTHFTASASTKASGSPAEECSVTAAASSGAAEQAGRKKSARKAFYYGPRATAPEQLQHSTAAAAGSVPSEATPSRPDGNSEKELPSAQLPPQTKPRRKPFAYGPRPAILNASTAEPGASAVERVARPAETSLALGEEAAAAAGMSSDVAPMAISPTPAGVISVDGGPGASLKGKDSLPAAIQRGPTGPPVDTPGPPRDSFTSEQESNTSRVGETAANLVQSSIEAAPLHRGRSTSVRKPFAYGPRKQAASENMAPNCGSSEPQDGGEGELGGALGVRQGWSADPRFIRR